MAHKTTHLIGIPAKVAAGTGKASIQASDVALYYWIGDNNAPPNAAPFMLTKGEIETFDLQAGEVLWMTGVGIAVVYAEVEPS